MRAIVFAVVAAVAIGSTAPTAAGSVLYGTANDGPSSELVYTIDQGSGLATALGDSGFGSPLDLTSDWRAASFQLWAADTGTNQLLEIDPLTGAGSAVGNFMTDVDMESLAFDVTTGTLYGTTSNDVLYKIDPATADSTYVGDVGFGSVFALAFDLSGRLYGVADDGNWLISIDTATGLGTAIANTDSDGITDIAARPEDGLMFAIDTIHDTLRTLNLTTGQTAQVGTYNASVDFMVGLAFSPIPEPTTFVILGVGMLAALRRRR